MRMTTSTVRARNVNHEKNQSTKEAFDLAFQKLNKGNFKEGENIYKKILKMEPNHVGAQNNLGIIFTYLKEFEKAKTCFENKGQPVLCLNSSNIILQHLPRIDTFREAAFASCSILRTLATLICFLLR